jgi:hypothetical protein
VRVSAEPRGRQCVRDAALDRTVQKLHLAYTCLYLNHLYHYCLLLIHLHTRQQRTCVVRVPRLPKGLINM